MTLLLSEMRRALHRRSVWVLVAISVAGCALAGVASFLSSAGESLAELQVDGDTHPALMHGWWHPGTGDGALLIALLFLLLGTFFGGATAAGAEWRAGTVTTVLTWEPRRTRLHLTRTAACGLLALPITFALQALFLAAFLPSVLAHGSTGGVDGAWWLALLGAMLRLSLLASLSGVIGVTLATLGRNTAFALVAGFGWVAVIETLIRVRLPDFARFLWAENVSAVATWTRIDGADFEREPLVALATILAYAALLVAVSSFSFSRRDVAATS